MSPIEKRLFIYRRALKIWGPWLQADKAEEEMLECGVEIAHFKKLIRKNDGQVEGLQVPDALIDELVDAQIMLEQMTLIITRTGDDTVKDRLDKKMDFKLQRLDERVKVKEAED